MCYIQSTLDFFQAYPRVFWGAFAVVIFIVARFVCASSIPSVKFSLLGLNNITRYSNDPVEFIRQAKAKYGEVFKVDMLFSSIIWLRSPQLNKEYLETREDVWSFGDGMGKFLNQIVGPRYFQHLKTFVSSLNKGITRAPTLSHYQQLAEAETEKAIASWEKRNDIELFESVSYLVHCIIIQCLMGPDFYENVDELFSLLHTMEANLGSIYNFILPDWVPHPAARRLWAARDRMQVIFKEKMQRRQQNPEQQADANDYISYTLSDPSTQHLEDLYAAHHTLLMFAAHTSTVALVSWTIFELLHSPTRLSNLRSSLSDQTTSSSPYLGALLRETSRHYSSMADVRIARRPKALHSPISSTAAMRSTRKPLVIPAGSLISISPYLTHHDPQLWTLPDAWYPERWLEEPDLSRRLNNKEVVGYMPFGAGSHRCPGEKMATMMAETVVGKIVQGLDMELMEGRGERKMELDFSKIGSPWLKGDVRVRVRKRESAA